MSTSTIYSHRNLSLQPATPGTAAPVPQVPQGVIPHASAVRLNESLEIVRQEFEAVNHDINVLKGVKEDYEQKVSAQVNEILAIRSAVYELEVKHQKLKQAYDDDLQRLRAEVTAVRQGIAVPQAMPDPNLRPPISVNDVLRQAPGLTANEVRSANPTPGYSYPEFRDRERERNDARMMDQREREREQQQPPPQPRDPTKKRALDPQDVEREQRERDAQRRQERNRVREEMGTMDHRRERERDRDERYGPGPASAKPGGSSYYGGGASGSKPPPPPPQALPPPPQPGPPGYGQPPPAMVPNSFPDDFNPETVPPELKKEYPDWVAVFTKPVRERRLDVTNLHTFLHESVVCCVRFSADGKYLATGCNRTAQIWDMKSGMKTCVLADESAIKTGDLYIRSLCFSPNGKYLATGAEDKVIRIWDIAKKQIRHLFEGHQQEIYSLAFSQDGRVIVSGSGDKTARIWDMETGSHRSLTINEPESVDAGVTSVAISPDGRLVAAGSLDTIVRVWDVQTGNLIERLMSHTDSVYSVAFTPDGKGLVSGSLDQSLKYWDVRPLLNHPSRTAPLRQPAPTGPGTAAEKGDQSEKGSVCTKSYDGHKDYVLSVAVSHDSQWVVSGSKDRCVQFWDLNTAQAQVMLQGHKNSVISIDLSPSGGMLATGSGDWVARVWRYDALN